MINTIQSALVKAAMLSGWVSAVLIVQCTPLNLNSENNIVTILSQGGNKVVTTLFSDNLKFELSEVHCIHSFILRRTHISYSHTLTLTHTLTYTHTHTHTHTYTRAHIHTELLLFA